MVQKRRRHKKEPFVTCDTLFGIYDQKGVFVWGTNFGPQTRPKKKQTWFRFLQHKTSVSNSLSFPRMVDKDGTGTSSTAKSLLEELHEVGGGKEK
jgi:hypothetical protein